MRPQALLPTVALVLLAACSPHADTSQSSASPNASPVPLASCEERQLSLDGATLLVQANVDRTPAQIVILSAPSDEARAKAYQDARKMFGDPKPDTRTQTRQYKYGLVQTTDLCGRPVMPAASPSP